MPAFMYAGGDLGQRLELLGFCCQGDCRYPCGAALGRLSPVNPADSIVGVIGPEPYSPDQWNNFFVLVGTGSAALTGLVFVAISVNLKDVLKDATHTYRAINMLTGFTAVFILSSFALMGHQTHQTVGLEWLIVSLLAGAINTRGYVRGFSLTGSRYALNLFRVVGGSACYLGQIIGSALFFLGLGWGIYVAATGVIVNFFFLVSGSWLLIVGTVQSPVEATRETSKRSSN